MQIFADAKICAALNRPLTVISAHARIFSPEKLAMSLKKKTLVGGTSCSWTRYKGRIGHFSLALVIMLTKYHLGFPGGVKFWKHFGSVRF